MTPSLGCVHPPFHPHVRPSRPVSYEITCVLTSPGSSPFTGAIQEEQLLSCGASDCVMATAPTNHTQSPSRELIYTLLGIYTGMCSQPRAEFAESKTQLLPGLETTVSPRPSNVAAQKVPHSASG